MAHPIARLRFAIVALVGLCLAVSGCSREPDPKDREDAVKLEKEKLNEARKKEWKN